MTSFRIIETSSSFFSRWSMTFPPIFNTCSGYIEFPETLHLPPSINFVHKSLLVIIHSPFFYSTVHISHICTHYSSNPSTSNSSEPVYICSLVSSQPSFHSLHLSFIRFMIVRASGFASSSVWLLPVSAFTHSYRPA